jgi:hypothetical protein
MPALLLMIASLVTNYVRHRLGKSTICSTCRKRVGPRVFVLGWAALTVWFIPHYCRPFTEAVADLLEGEEKLDECN